MKEQNLILATWLSLWSTGGSSVQTSHNTVPWPIEKTSWYIPVTLEFEAWCWPAATLSISPITIPHKSQPSAAAESLR